MSHKQISFTNLSDSYFDLYYRVVSSARGIDVPIALHIMSIIYAERAMYEYVFMGIF